MNDNGLKKNLPAETNLQILIVKGSDKTNEPAMESTMEIQIETEQAAEESDMEFMSAESSRVEDAEITVLDGLGAIGDPTPAKETVESFENQNEIIELKSTDSSDQDINGDEPRQSSDCTQSAQEQLAKVKKGPPPGLLPLKSSLVNNGETRSPRQAALKSAERTKMIAKLQTSASQSYNERDVTALEAAQGITDAEASNVSLQKIIDPSLNICDSCKKLECLLYQTTGRHSKKELKFCNRKCIQAYFKYATLHFPHGKDDEDKDENHANNGNTKQGAISHIIVEPDIEIQTSSDEFQMDVDEANTSTGSNGPMTLSHLEDIATATKEALVCASCKKCLVGINDSIQWEAMEFCSDKCLRSYVKAVGFHCNYCSAQVTEQNLGKLCVRFGTVIRQFCSSDCLEKFKSKHKLCTQCQVNMTDKEKSYCSDACQELSRRLVTKFPRFGEKTCAVCRIRKAIRYDIVLARQTYWICSKPCRNAFRFAHKMTTLSCSICTRYFDVKANPRYLARVNGKQGSNDVMWFCSSTCFATHLFRKRKIELCSRCQVKKYNVDMIRKPLGSKAGSDADGVFYCSLYCYTYNQLLPTTSRKRTTDSTQTGTKTTTAPIQATPPILHAVSLASIQPQVASVTTTTSTAKQLGALTNTTSQQPISTPTTIATTQANPPGSAILPIEVQHKIVTLPPKPKEMKNKAVWCRPIETKKSVSTEPFTGEESAFESKKPVYIPIPVPVPIYVPIPMAMYSIPTPFPVGFPVPYPTPIMFSVDVEDTRAIIRALEESKSESIPRAEQDTEPVVTDEASTDKNSDEQASATKNEESENALKSEEVVKLQESKSESDEKELVLPGKDLEKIIASYTLGKFSSSRKRSASTSTSSASKRMKSEYGRRSSDSEENFSEPGQDTLKQEFGVRAWSTWLKQRNRSRLDKQSFTEDVNSDLVEFLRRLRKPSGENYRPDILLYLLYGMSPSYEIEHQERNLFIDSSLLPFQEELDKHLQPFYEQVVRVVREGDQSSLVTCLRESHLWNSRQLGVHSPMLLIFTMLYFNTKCFHLYTPEQHESLSFASIQKVPQKNTGETNGPKTFSRVFCLQYTPITDTSNLTGGPVQRQNPPKIRQNFKAPQQCPVKLYNFYISKCPESAKTRRDIFYLMPLEKTAPDAVWYSTQPVPREILTRMLHRVVFIEEVLRNLCASDSAA